MATRADRLSPLDASFLYFERPMQRLHVGCVAVLDGPLAFPAFVDTVGKRLAAIPRYRQRPVRPLLDLDWPRWGDDPHFAVPPPFPPPPPRGRAGGTLRPSTPAATSGTSACRRPAGPPSCMRWSTRSSP